MYPKTQKRKTQKRKNQKGGYNAQSIPVRAIDNTPQLHPKPKTPKKTTNRKK